MRQCLEAGSLFISYKENKKENEYGKIKKEYIFLAKIVGTKKINGSDNARCAENGIRL